jgi:maltose alpha-D-glucosyltransferase/alpha-amylase
LAPLLNNDIDRIKLMNSLLLSMPGSPIIYYGDEIGMGDNIYIGDRNGVRTPMQWSLDRNAGYSRADPQRLYLPVIMDPIYGFQAVNAEAQSRDPSSLLNWTRRILAVRQQHHCFGRGTLEFVRAHNRKIMAYVRSFGTEHILCVANLAQTAQAVELDLSKYKGRVPVELLGRNAFPPIGELPYFLTLPAHGFFWLLLSDSAAPPSWHVERLPTAEVPVLVLTEGLATLLADASGAPSTPVAKRTMKHLEHEVLPEFLAPRGWLLKDQGQIGSARLGVRTLWRFEQRTFLLNYLEVQHGERASRYFLPMTIAWEDATDSGALRTAEWTLAKVREHARAGVLIDAFADPLFCSHLVRCIAQRATVPFGNGELRFEQDANLDDLETALAAVHHIGSESTNTSIVFNDRLFMKVYRRAEAGVHPDVEMVRHLSKAGFTAVAPLLGTIAHVADDRTELASLFAYVRNQGDAWTYTLNHLDRFIGALSASDSATIEAPHALFVAQIHTLGRRLGEMHALLCGSQADPAFAPEPISQADLNNWVKHVLDSARPALDRLERVVKSLPEIARGPAQTLLNSREVLDAHVRALCCEPVAAMKIRIHGNLHLGKVMLVADDFMITGFEGDISLPSAERRKKDSSLRDVASFLRSLQYARYAALEHSLATRPDLHERLEPRLQEWEDLSSEALIAGYQRGFGDARCAPADRVGMMRLLDLFQIDRALREVQSEIEYRPAWVSVPCRALLSLLERKR